MDNQKIVRIPQDFIDITETFYIGFEEYSSYIIEEEIGKIARHAITYKIIEIRSLLQHPLDVLDGIRTSENIVPKILMRLDIRTLDIRQTNIWKFCDFSINHFLIFYTLKYYLSNWLRLRVYSYPL